jgi:2'-5' RNA ligase
MAARPRRKFGPSQKDRIFFACVPDEKTAARIHALAGDIKHDKSFQANLILPEHLHVTLFHLGDWQSLPEEIVNVASGAASGINVAAFDVVFDRAESFRNSTGIYPFVLSSNVTQWRVLHEALGNALKDAGLGAATRGDFKPHMTLTYDRQRVKPFSIDPVVWKVKDFVLVHSVLGKTTHIHLGRWPLKDI